MSRLRVQLLGIVFALLPIACGRSTAPASRQGEEPDTPPAARVIAAPAKEAPAEDVKKLVESNTAFAFNLYAKLQDQKQLFISPYSISSALAMLYAGARGATAEEIAKACRFDAKPEALPAIHATLRWQQLGKPGGYEWNDASAVWVRRGAAFRPAYLDLLRRGFGAEARETDFGAAASDEISRWIARETRNKIPNLKIKTTADTQMVLASAVYFKADWNVPFLPSATYDEPFSLTATEQIKTPLMHHPMIHLNYLDGGVFQAVELPYQENASMFVLLPKKVGTAELDAVLTADNFKAWLAKMQARPVVVSLPKFELRQELKLPDVLQALGMVKAFTPQADFTGALSEPMFVNQVVHGTYVKVDEQGTEAAAGTVVETKKDAASEPPRPVDFRVNRPFVLVICDNRTGSVLFLGRVIDPRGGQ